MSKFHERFAKSIGFGFLCSGNIQNATVFDVEDRTLVVGLAIEASDKKYKCSLLSLI